MKIETMIKMGWRGVQTAHPEGYLSNYEMFVLVFSKSLMALPERPPAIYDGRNALHSPHKPNFFIWSKDDKPTVTFFGKFRFQPSNAEEIDQDLRELSRVIGRSEIDVLTDSKNQTETRMQMSPEVEYGYFLLTDRSVHSVERKIRHDLSGIGLGRFHLAIGPVSQGKKSSNTFRYFPPKS